MRHWLVDLSLAKKAGAVRVTAYIDSKLVKGQVTSEYEAKEDRMKKYLARVIELISHFEAIKVRHIPRGQNEQADQLAKLASNDKYITKNWLPVSHPNQPSAEESCILIYANEPEEDWRTPIT